MCMEKVEFQPTPNYKCKSINPSSHHHLQPNLRYLPLFPLSPCSNYPSMEKIILSPFLYIPTDQIQISFRIPFFGNGFHFPSHSQKMILFPSLRSDFALPRRKNPSHIKCSSLDKGLQPKPTPKPAPVDEFKDDLQETQIRTGLCHQIEKLVFFKRYGEALELFEFVDYKDDYGVNEQSTNYVVDSSTYDALVNACIGLKSIRGVKRVYNYMIKSGFEPDQYLRNRVLLMHVKCGMMIDAHRLFDEMPERNLVSWNTIIGGLVDSGDYMEAFRLFSLMWEELSDGGSRTFTSAIRAAAGLGIAFAGRQVHSCIVKMGINKDIYVSCALIDMYSKCGCIEDAQFVFEEMPEKTVVGWNSIIASYALHGYSEKALDLYYEMRDSGVKIDHFTYSILVSICCRLASLDHAKQAHAGLVRHGFGSDIVANTALVDFYSKWGRVEDAWHVFDNMPAKNVKSWNALIAGYGNHGKGNEAIELFQRMICAGMVPNHVTFLAVLSACSYSGLSDEGWDIFESMSRDHKIKPRAMHYACMIELLGREGLLDEAFAMIKDAPFRPTENMWAALLTACRFHQNLELGKFAAARLFEMEPEKLSNYIILLNIYNSSRRPDEAAKVVQILKKKGLRLLPACSWIEIKKRPQGFIFGDKSHPQSKEIYKRLDKLVKEIGKRGYVPDRKSLLPDVKEDEEQLSYYHSEMLAITFGLINTSDSTSLQVVQGHRVCGNCHQMIKLITMVMKREIVVRDASRFHHFKDGTCSCGDYW